MPELHDKFYVQVAMIKKLKMRNIQELKEAIQNKVPLVWNDPDFINGADYTITYIEPLTDDIDDFDPIFIEYGYGSTAEVYLHEIIYAKNENWTMNKKDEIEKILINIWSKMPMDIPSNYEDIVQYCYEDVCETADPNKWGEGDVIIAFRRYIEDK